MKGITVVKLGGAAASDSGTLGQLAEELASILNVPPVVVHGGGAIVSNWSRRLGVEPRFEDGVRMTSTEEMDVVEMVLAGSVNTGVVRLLCAHQHKAVGLSLSDCSLVSGVALAAGPENRTARPGEVRTDLIRHLLEGGYTPVISSVGTMNDGGPCNINADEAALALARALGASQLVFLSDVPGVLIGDEVRHAMNETDVATAIAEGHISGGMIPKVRSALDATSHGVGRVIIGQYGGTGDFTALLEGTAGSRLQGRPAEAGECV